MFSAEFEVPRARGNIIRWQCKYWGGGAEGWKIHGRVISETHNITGGKTSHPSETVPLRHATLLQLLSVYISTVICSSIGLSSQWFPDFCEADRIPFPSKPDVILPTIFTRPGTTLCCENTSLHSCKLNFKQESFGQEHEFIISKRKIHNEAHINCTPPLKLLS